MSSAYASVDDLSSPVSPAITPKRYCEVSHGRASVKMGVMGMDEMAETLWYQLCPSQIAADSSLESWEILVQYTSSS
jgi:hypothetical protein